jgi:uncharacterized membrane protein
VASIVERYKREDNEFDRAIAFIDATFAVAMTLLVTTLDVDTDAGSWSSVGDLYDSGGSQFIAFAISFVVIAGYWLAHYRLFAGFVGIDIPVIVANLVLLAAIVVLPFTTEYAGDPDINDLALPTVIVSINIAAVSSAFTVVYVLAVRRGLARRVPAPQEVLWSALALLAPAMVFLLSIPIAVFADPVYAQLSWLALIVVNPWFGRRAARAAATGDDASDSAPPGASPSG